MINRLVDERINFAIVFTKIDKGSQKERSKYLKEFQQQIKKITTTLPDLFFVTNTSGKGKDELLNYIEEIINLS